MERPAGIEPASTHWQCVILPLYYDRPRYRRSSLSFASTRTYSRYTGLKSHIVKDTTNQTVGIFTHLSVRFHFQLFPIRSRWLP